MQGNARRTRPLITWSPLVQPQLLSGSMETMQLPVVTLLFLFGFPNPHFWECSCQASEFNLDGDYLIGGLFPLHYTPDIAQTRRPEAVNCLE